MRILTDTPGINNIGYPTCRTWSSDSRGIFIESSRPRPDGISRPGEVQLLKIDIESGAVTHLATLEAEADSPAPLNVPTNHTDYAPLANTLIYSDMPGHNMHMLNLHTGKRALILHEAEGAIGNPLSVSPDGTRICYYAEFPGIENRFFIGPVFAIFVLDVDPVNMEAIGEPQIVEAYPARKGPTFAENPRDRVHVNHCQINPANKDHISYAHEFGGVQTDGSIPKTRLWQVMADGSNNRPFDRQKPNECHTHEVFGPMGKSLYFPSSGKIWVIDFETGEKRLIVDAPEHWPWHITVSPDERWIAADRQVRDGVDSHGNPISGILLVDVKTGEHQVLCRFSRGINHPAHPHPNFSPDGEKIAFVVADGPNTQVAYVDVSEIVKTAG